MDTYKGESTAKKRARVEFWMSAYDRLETIKGGTIVTLASREMGDYGVVKHLLPDHPVISVDREWEAVAAAREKYPEADVRLGDVVDVVRDVSAAGTPIAGVFLDFCAPFCVEVLETIQKCVQHVAVGGVFGVGLLKGREKDGNGVADLGVTPNRKLRKALFRNSKKRALEAGRDPEFYETLRSIQCGRSPLRARSFQDRIGDDRDGWACAGERRAKAIAMLVGNVTSTKWLRLGGVTNYQSRTKSSNGVPMIYCNYTVVEPGRIERDDRNRRRIVGDSLIDEGGVRNVKFTGDEEQWLRKTVGTFADVSVAAEIFNVPVLTARAWKAHATRGTYAAAAE